ncbi:zinc finger MYM-type protein 1 [Caerostris darwini]|uniref:Zinc finger MYM-type protein 1 n=1 Tax=Caerostris darwini TaxID=1538125 RepID=A0AAV4TBM8_9ARAC|nr:zinc finger MYM-type protein 1 [Caerostris darwini]
MEILAQENVHICLKLYGRKLFNLQANKVKNTFMAEVKNSGYFSYSVDSAPDISHTDQLTLIIRCVSPEDGLPTKRFLTSLELKDHSGESIADLVFNYITTELKIDFRKFRGQSYDNAANMAGRYNGMQQNIIEKKNKFARFVPCTFHSLNLDERLASFAVRISNSTPFDNQRRDFKPVPKRVFITTNKESFVKNITWTT